VKLIFKYLRTCKKEIILTAIFIFLEVICEILIPVLTGFVIDKGLNASNFNIVYKYGALMIILAILSLIFGILATRNASVASSQLARNLREAQYNKIQEFSFENIDHFKTSSLITRISMDVRMIQQAFQMNIRISLRAPLLLIFSIVASAIVGGNLVLIFVAVIPTLSFGLGLIMFKAHKHFKKMFKKIDNMNLKIQEDLAGIKTIKSYVREDYENEEFKKVSIDVSQNSKRAEKWIIFNNPLMQFSMGACFVLIAYFGSKNMILGTLSQGQFLNVITYVMQILVSLMMVSQVFLMSVISRASVERINEVLNTKSTLVEIENPIEKINDGSFEFKNVGFKYSTKNDKFIFKNLNFKFPSGSFVGIFGATGTGKTTLIQLISRLYDTSEGEVLVSGNNVKNYSLDAIRSNVVTVLQKNVLFKGSVRENMKWGKKDASDDEIILALKKAKAYDFIFQNPEKLDFLVDRGGANFSGGQRQRLCIARALISNPKILILDDSTSAVDTKTDAAIKNELNSIKNMTKIVISQRLSSIENADYIIILDEKGINEIGNHESLMNKNKIYSEVYAAQKQGRIE